jgi:hypothetical protein
MSGSFPSPVPKSIVGSGSGYCFHQLQKVHQTYKIFLKSQIPNLNSKFLNHFSLSTFTFSLVPLTVNLTKPTVNLIITAVNLIAWFWGWTDCIFMAAFILLFNHKNSMTMKNQKRSGESPKEKICPYALSGFPKRITFIRKKEDPIEDIFTINYITCSLDNVDIFLKGKCKAAERNVTLNYMRQRLPPCLFFYCGKSILVNMSRVKSWCWTGKRIRLVLIRNKELYVSRLRTCFFLALVTLYPGIQCDDNMF